MCRSFAWICWRKELKQPRCGSGSWEKELASRRNQISDGNEVRQKGAKEAFAIPPKIVRGIDEPRARCSAAWKLFR
jgi:hypothetical protein